MKKVLVIFMVLFMVFGLVACGDNSDEGNPDDSQPKNSEQDTTESNEEKDNENEEDSEGKVEETEIGKRVTVKSKKGLDLEKETGPFNIKVTDVQISTLEPSEEYKEMFNGKDKVTFITLVVEAENTTDETNSFYPDQGTIVTDTKEQVEADLVLSDQVGGDFIGNVVKEGNVIFLLDSAPEEINKIKYIVGNPYDQDINSIGEEVNFEITFD